MQGDGLLILSGERQRQLQEQITATDIVKVTHTQENGELQKQVRYTQEQCLMYVHMLSCKASHVKPAL